MEQGRQLSFGDIIQEGKDNLNNIWYKDGNSIYLKLASEKFARKIGMLFDGRFITFRKNKHIFQKNDSYGFNEDVVKSIGAEEIYLIDEEGSYIFPSEVLYDLGEYLHFKSEGFERQKFLGRHVIKAFKNITLQDNKRIDMMGLEWFNLVREEFYKPYMVALGKWLGQRRKIVKVNPSSENIFRAFKEVPFNHIKVVVVGQDPYPQEGVADGLAFSSALDYYKPASLQIIYQAIEKEYNKLIIDGPASLIDWAHQGVLLLNRNLTVDVGNPGSHKDVGWKTFTDIVINRLAERPSPIVFLLWGSSARQVRKIIQEKGQHFILEAEHPAFAARDSREWDNHGCFKKTNQLLESIGKSPIEWANLIEGKRPSNKSYDDSGQDDIPF